MVLLVTESLKTGVISPNFSLAKWNKWRQTVYLFRVPFLNSYFSMGLIAL